jgi:methylthioribulose-1-phosphate dehydratase
MEEAEAGAVLHSHSQAGTLLSRLALEQAETTPAAGSVASLEHSDLEMLKGLEGIRSHATRVTVPVLANDQDIARLAAAVRPLLPHCPWGFLVAGHGLYAWGTDLASARRHLEIHEFLLEQHWRFLLLQATNHLGRSGPWQHQP